MISMKSIPNISACHWTGGPALMRVLIIEPEMRLGEYLLHGLTESGFVVDVVDNAMDGVHLGVTGEYDLLVLDRSACFGSIDAWAHRLARPDRVTQSETHADLGFHGARQCR